MTTELLTVARAAVIGKLEQLHEEVQQVATPLSDEELWRKPLEPGNSIGHLILHLTGNLNHFVGAQLGGSDYVRDREREFTETQRPPRQELLTNLDSAVATFRRVVEGLAAEQL